MKKEKNYYFRDYVPIIIGGIILLVLIFALYLLLNYKTPSGLNEITDDDTGILSEKNVDVSASACPNIKLSDYVEKANKVTVSYEYKDESRGMTEIDSDDSGAMEEVFIKVPYIYISNVSDDIYVTLEDNNQFYEAETTKITSSDLVDNFAEIKKNDSTKLVTYTIKVYSRYRWMS